MHYYFYNNPVKYLFYESCYQSLCLRIRLPSFHMKGPLFCPMSESPSRKREGFQDNVTRKKREVYC